MIVTINKSRQLTSRIMLTRRTSVEDAFGHQHLSEPVDVLEVYADVKQMSDSKTLLTYQLADVVGVEMWIRATDVSFDGFRWRGHVITVSSVEDVDNRGRWMHITGYYSKDVIDE